MEDDEDEELSDLESMDEDEEDATVTRKTGARVRGGDVTMKDEEDDEEDGDGESDDDETSLSMSRGDTPDLSKLTRRQRAAYEDLDGGLMALSNGIIVTFALYSYQFWLDLLLTTLLFHLNRSTKEEASHSRGARHAKSRNGPST